MRRLTFSTTTALVRPWLKLWRTTPCSTPLRLSVSVLVEVTVSFSPGFLSFQSYASFDSAGSVRRAFASRIATIARAAGSKPFKAPRTREKGLARPPGQQGCMYHIWAAQCQIQLRRGQEFDHIRRLGPASAARRFAAAWHRACGFRRPAPRRHAPARSPARSASAVSALAKPATTRPALPAIARASSTALRAAAARSAPQGPRAAGHRA